jgi:hypothetical protein
VKGAFGGGGEGKGDDAPALLRIHVTNVLPLAAPAMRASQRGELGPRACNDRGHARCAAVRRPLPSGHQPAPADAERMRHKQ